jgi:hypothetical protein
MTADETTDDMPEAIVTEVSVRTVRTVKVRCPHCGENHVHGWRIGTAAPGVRVSHCRRDRRSYLIVVPS